jgi:hypothetical protein
MIARIMAMTNEPAVIEIEATTPIDWIGRFSTSRNLTIPLKSGLDEISPRVTSEEIMKAQSHIEGSMLAQNKFPITGATNIALVEINNAASMPKIIDPNMVAPIKTELKSVIKLLFVILRYVIAIIV